MTTIAENFDQYFRIRHVRSQDMANIAYQIRYKVYVKEMGWEQPNDSGLETDQFDPYSHICLLEHRRTETFAGCVRLVVPVIDRPDTLLPFQHHGILCTQPEVLDPDRLQRGSYGEISRLAVPDTFRRRKHERNRPFILDETSSTTIYSEEEKRSFPNIAIGLYLASIAMVDLFQHEGVFVVMEPKLRRHLQRFGLPFSQLSQEFDFRGMRALFGLPKADLYSHMSIDIRELYELIKSSLAPQLRSAGKLTGMESG